jgi:hypothetical protein
MTHRTVFRATSLRIIYTRLKGEPSSAWVDGQPEGIEIDRIITDHGDEIGSVLSDLEVRLLRETVLAELQAEWKIEEKSL